ncbi:hypothetical protein NPIL_469051 [Nephila pilipes]|uniref:Uncharacterized protein n=1 Tax=Nephila pilipes TaxID=299642 RepID=A0A8X6T8M5_NEPPI|nr:hypothetical protein NPIL_469051 [Nephila pilipes]
MKDYRRIHRVEDSSFVVEGVILRRSEDLRLSAGCEEYHSIAFADWGIFRADAAWHDLARRWACISSGDRTVSASPLNV